MNTQSNMLKTSIRKYRILNYKPKTRQERLNIVLVFNHEDCRAWEYIEVEQLECCKILDSRKQEITCEQYLTELENLGSLENRDEYKLIEYIEKYS